MLEKQKETHTYIITNKLNSKEQRSHTYLVRKGYLPPPSIPLTPEASGRVGPVIVSMGDPWRGGGPP